MVDNTNPSLIDKVTNGILTNIPSTKEIIAAIFSLNGDNAPGPDGFGATFYQTYWGIVKQDVSNAMIHFFSSGWVLPGFNANTIILIPKVLDMLRLIAVANFKFKIVSKVLADKLAAIMMLLVSKEQRGFIQRRITHNCIGLAF